MFCLSYRYDIYTWFILNILLAIHFVTPNWRIFEWFHLCIKMTNLVIFKFKTCSFCFKTSRVFEIMFLVLSALLYSCLQFIYGLPESFWLCELWWTYCQTLCFLEVSGAWVPNGSPIFWSWIDIILKTSVVHKVG